MERTTRSLLALFVAGNCALGYADYNQQMKASAETWMQVVHGTANAPDQYRVGAVMAAYWITQHTPLTLSQAFGTFDLIAALAGTLVLYEVTRRSRIFQDSSVAVQWFGSAAFLALTMYLMEWTAWYRKVSTLPTLGTVAAMLWMWTLPAGSTVSRRRQAAVATGFFMTAVGLSFVRADVALMVCGGIFAGSLTRFSPNLALPRKAAIAVSLVSGIAVGFVQLWLVKVLYPEANYGGVHVWMIAHDWWRLTKWAIALLFSAPFLWTVKHAWQTRRVCDGAEAAFLLGALGYAAMWICFGRLDEVRIFLPMAMAVTPLTVELAMRRLEAPQIGPE